MKLGLAFICGNETTQIEEMLDSVECVKFDSISAVLTRDSIPTEEILKERGCKTTKLEEPWKEGYSNWDFAKARQISYDNCDADWIIYLDTDDVLWNAEGLRKLVEECENYDSIVLPYDYEPNNIYSKERVVKKGKYKWRGLVHECLIPISEVKPFVSDSVVVVHKSVLNNRFERNLFLIEKEYKTKNKTPRTVYYCGKDSFFLGKTEKAKKYFKEFLETKGEKTEKHSACMYLVGLAGSDLAEAEKWCKEAIKLLPEFAEPYLKLAWISFNRGNYRKCIDYTNFAFSEKILAPPFGTPHNKLVFSVYPKQLLDIAIAKEAERMDISKMSLNELKVLAYDQISLLEQAQVNLKAINEAIAKKNIAAQTERQVSSSNAIVKEEKGKKG